LTRELFAARERAKHGRGEFFQFLDNPTKRIGETILAHLLTFVVDARNVTALSLGCMLPSN
jgi:hypothetical protein